MSTLSVPDFLALSELTQRAAELEVRLDICESERRHARTTLESVPAPLIITDPFDDIVLLSESAVQLFGIERETVIGQAIGAFFSGCDLHDLVREARESRIRGNRKTVRRTLATRAGRRFFEVTLLCVANCEDGAPSPWGVVILLAPEPATLPEETTAALTLIRSYADILRSSAGDDPEIRRRYADAIASESSRLLAGVNEN